MTDPIVVFVHGVPETAAIWRKVQTAIDRESVAVQLPGFGRDRPDGFGATKDDYAAWLVDELDHIGRPVDLVGHDWGAGITYRVATTAGDRLRSWAADVANIVHPDYEWHDFARIWQTPGEGEAFVEGQATTPAAERAPLFEAMGVPADDALELAGAADETMGRCILDLYRSAVPNPWADWGPFAPTSAAGLVLHPSDDPFGHREMAEEVAAMLGAGFAVLPDTGHFWPYQSPEVAAAVLGSFWQSLEN